MEAIAPPQPASVIAISLGCRLAGKTPPRASLEIFVTQIGSALVQSCDIRAVAAPDGDLLLTIIVPETTQILSLLRRIASVRQEFERNLPTLITRQVIHHGIVFPTRQGPMGAVLRAAHTRLQSLAKLPGTIQTVATDNFIAYTRSWPGQTPDLHVASQPCCKQYDIFEFSLNGNPPPSASDKTPEDWTTYLTERLAEHLGPFARVLVDSASRSSSTPEQLAQEVASEIDEKPLRERFLSDALNHLRLGRIPL